MVGSGVTVVEVPDDDRDGRTVRVLEPVPGTPASQSGIQRGDTVMRIDSHEIYRPADVLDASFFSQVGGSMTVVVRRKPEAAQFQLCRDRAAPASHRGAGRLEVGVNGDLACGLKFQF